MRACLCEALDLQQDPSDFSWMFDADYTPVRERCKMFLQVLGCFQKDEETVGLLREGLSLRDPALLVWAAVSLVRLGEPVDGEVWETLGASHQSRLTVWEQLHELGLSELLPEPWASPAALAAADLSRWLAHPAEMGVAPEQIELMATHTVPFEGASEDVFVFRFREYAKPWEAGEGWMAGVAGPLRDGVSLRSAWSSFAPWGSQTAEGHFAALFADSTRC